MNEDSLPPFLHNTEPLEPEDLPLQLALVTMEVAELRHRLAAMALLYVEMARLVSPANFLPELPIDER